MFSSYPIKEVPKMMFVSQGIVIDHSLHGLTSSKLYLDAWGKGIPEDQAHEVLVKEALDINVEELKGCAMEAAVYSFIT